MASNEALKKIVDEAVEELDMEEARYLIERVCSDALTAAGVKPETAYMEVPRCDRCRWWQREGFVWDLGDCMRPFESAAKFGPGQTDGSIQTEPDFGCVQFEARQEPS